MLRRLRGALLALPLALTLPACGEQDPAETDPEQTTTTETGVSHGRPLWLRTFPSGGVTDVALDEAEKSVLVTGYSNLRVIASSQPVLGEPAAWTHTFGPGYFDSVDVGTAVSAGPNSSVVVVGTLQSPDIDFGDGWDLVSPPSAFALTLGAAVGQTVWSKVFDELGGATGVALTPDNGIVFTAWHNELKGMLVKLDASSGLAWFVDLGWLLPAAVEVGADGDIVVAGLAFTTIDLGGGPLGPEGGSLVVARLGPQGEHVWSRAFVDAETSFLPGNTIISIARDEEGGVYLTGSVRGPVDFGGGALAPLGGKDVFVAKLTADGEHVWSARYGGEGDDIGKGIAVGAGGDVFVAGDFHSSMQMGDTKLEALDTKADVFVARMASGTGEIGWSLSFGGQSEQIASSIAAGSGAVVVAGQFHDDLRFNPLSATTESIDGYVIALEP